MQISLHNVGKKFIHNWAFRNIDFEFAPGQHYGLLGKNGSGKSTMLRIIAGLMSPSEGQVKWSYAGIDPGHNLFRYLMISSPHMELIDEFTLSETLDFHQRLKPFLPGITKQDIIALSGLKTSTNKPLKYYSSGMKQRVKLLLASLSDTPMVILDEPCSNLDKESVKWYQELIGQHLKNRTLIIGSNDQEAECISCEGFLQLTP